MRISAAEFAKRFGELSDEALAQPLIITRHGRDRLVVMSLAKYRELTNPGQAKQIEGAIEVICAHAGSSAVGVKRTKRHDRARIPSRRSRATAPSAAP